MGLFEPGERKQRVRAMGDHQLQPRWQVVEQERHRLVHGSAASITW